MVDVDSLYCQKINKQALFFSPYYDSQCPEPKKKKGGGWNLSINKIHDNIM